MFAALPPAPPPAVAAPTVTAVATDTHRVRPGDTLSGIALRYGVSQGDLRRANGLRGDLIRSGARLTIPSGGHRTASASTPTRGSGQSARNGGSRQARAAILSAARRYGVNSDLALAVGWQESRWRQHARSNKGAVGAMQCLPSTGEWMSGKAGRTLNLADVGDNATCGVLLLKTLQRQAGSEREAIGAYYQGMASLKKRGAYDDTKQYVSSVQKHRDDIAAGKKPRG